MISKLFRIIKVAIFLSLRFLVRGNLGITILTVIMIAMIYINLLFVPSLIQGVSNKINDQLIDSISSNISITGSDNKTPIDNTDAFLRAINKQNNVSISTSRTRAGTQISSNSNSSVVNIESIDPNTDSKVFETSRNIIEGSYLEPNDTDKIMLGIQLAGAGRTDLVYYATSLKTVHAGDKVSVLMVDGQRRDFTVKGIYKNDFILSDNSAFITKTALNSLIPSTIDKSTSIFVKTNTRGDEQTVINSLKSVRSDVKYDKWQSLQGVIKDQLDTFAMVNGILRSISLLVAFVTIFIITYVDLVNKRKQIGIERAIGIKSSTIVISYLLKAVYYSLIAVAFGVLLYLFAIVPFVEAHPFHFPNGLVVLAVDKDMMINDAISIVIVAIISAFIPAFNTIRMKILNAIWGV